MKESQDRIIELEEVRQCYYCKGKEFIPKFSGVKDRLHQSQHSWNFVECTACKALILTPRPKDEDLAGFYPKHYTFSMNDHASNRLRKWLAALEYHFHFRWIYRSEAKIIMRLAGKKNGQNVSVLDVGCGNGLLLKEFRNFGCTVEGIDMRADVVQYVSHVLGISARHLDADTLSDAYPSASFDIITLIHSLEHVTDPAGLLAQCLSLLKPGGIVAIAVPLSDSLQISWIGRKSNNIKEAPRHVSLPSQESMFSIIKPLDNYLTQWQADSLLVCAASYGISLFPDGATTQQYGHRKLHAIVNRFLATLITYLSMPMVFVENKILRKPVAGIFAMRKQ